MNHMAETTKEIIKKRVIILVLSIVNLACVYYEIVADRIPTTRDWLALLLVEIILQYIITPKHKNQNEKIQSDKMVPRSTCECLQSCPNREKLVQIN